MRARDEFFGAGPDLVRVEADSGKANSGD